MINFNYWRGAVLATACAGPVFIAPAFLMPLPPIGPGAFISGLIALVGIAIVFGAVIAFLPIFFGGYFMALWGSRNPRARHPAAWALAGVLFAVPVAVIMASFGRGDMWIWAVFAYTGAACALIVRYGTRWDDDIA